MEAKVAMVVLVSRVSFFLVETSREKEINQNIPIQTRIHEFCLCLLSYKQLSI